VGRLCFGTIASIFHKSAGNPRYHSTIKMPPKKWGGLGRVFGLFWVIPFWFPRFLLFFQASKTFPKYAKNPPHSPQYNEIFRNI
jgi:hypothetical protein